MNTIKFNLYPGGVSHCLTMSYDDGPAEDLRLLDIFNQNGIRGTFHLNSGSIFSRVHAEKLAAVYAGHEISCHMVSHPFPEDLPDMALLAEIQEDRRTLETAAGCVVRGMSYPFGNYNRRVIQVLRTAGIEYSRTTRATNAFTLPEDFLEWHPTCHHNGGILEKFREFEPDDRWGRAKLLYIWGHSFEFPRNDNWSMMEEFCRMAGHRENIWYATNIEIVDYVNAARALRFSVNCDRCFNPSAVDVWFSVNGEKACCKAGECLTL
ncbi:MAG: polysaccharide deacetylase family protein [Eubacteriales bacterium]